MFVVQPPFRLKVIDIQFTDVDLLQIISHLKDTEITVDVVNKFREALKLHNREFGDK